MSVAWWAMALGVGLGTSPATWGAKAARPAGEGLPAPAAGLDEPTRAGAAGSALAAPSPAEVVDPEDRWGVRIESVRLTAAGRVVDVRYRVVDAEKARLFATRKDKPALLDESSGAVLRVPTAPTVGPLRVTSNLESGRVYFILFANPGRQIRAGAKVALTVGGLRAANLVVQ